MKPPRNQENEIETRYIKRLNRIRFMYHTLLILAIFAVCFGFIVLLSNGKGKDTETAYKIWFIVFNVIGGTAAVFAIKEEEKYIETLKNCPCCKKHN